MIATLAELLPSAPLFVAFLGASFLLAVTPGPGVLYIVARSLAMGRQSGLASVAGVALGNFGNALAASLGLAALFAISSMAFTIVKYAGALYLVYLGAQALRGSRGPASAATVAPHGVGRVFRDGFVVALLNPKTTIFFAAFLPQFMSAGASPVAQSILLGAIFVLIAALTDSAYALAAGAASALVTRQTDRAARMRKAGRWLSAATFIGLGLWTALSGTRPKGAN